MPKQIRIDEPLDKQVEHAIEEARMVLPGIQALFGFQLIAIFNQRFATDLPPFGKYLHLAALILVAISIGLIMAPAAYHRQAEPDIASRFFVRYASRLITVAMAPLAVALSIEVGIVAFMVALSIVVASIVAASLLLLLILLWFVLPRRVNE